MERTVGVWGKGRYVAPPSRPHFYRPNWAPEPTPNQTLTPPYPRILYKSNTSMDTFSKSCIHIHWIQIQHFEFVSNPRSYGYDFWKLYPIQDQTDTIFETWIQSGTLWIQFFQFLLSKSKIIRDTMTKLNPNPGISSYKIKWIRIQ